MPEPWIQIVRIRQPTGHNHLQCTHNISKKTPQRNLSPRAPHQDEGRTRDPSPLRHQDHHRCDRTLHLSPTVSNSLKDLVQSKPTTAKRHPKLQHHLLFRCLCLHISNLTAARKDLQAHAKSQWVGGCKSCLERRAAGLSWRSKTQHCLRTRS